MTKILITGCSGQLGKALNERLKYGADTAVLNTARTIENQTMGMRNNNFVQWERMDIADKKQVFEIVEKFKPHIIINCAAYTAVDMCEAEEDRAYSINALGAWNLAAAAEKAGAKLIQISTDYVFDGKKNSPYVESDKPDPVTAYGRTKLAGEEAVKKYCSRYFIIRTAWLYGDGKNFVKTMLRLGREKKEVRVVNDQTGTPTSADELAKMILAVMHSDYYGTYHGTCEGEATWYEFACEIFRLAKEQVKVVPITTEEFPTAASRPLYSVLENKRLKELFPFRMKGWKEALREYMEKTVE